MYTINFITTAVRIYVICISMKSTGTLSLYCFVTLLLSILKYWISSWKLKFRNHWVLFTIYALLCSQQFTASSSCAGIARRTTHEAAAVGSSLQPWFDTWYTYRYIHTGTCLCHIIRYTVRGTVYPGTPYDDTDSKRMSYSVDTPRTRTSSPFPRPAWKWY